MPLKILHLEDDERDAVLIEDLLNQQRVPCVCTRVENERDFRASLESQNISLVLADLSLPTFDGKSALRIVQETRPHIPFIFVSGTLGEEAAIESIKLGATDYVLKSRLSRLPLAVERAVLEARERNERRQLERQFLGVQRLESFGMIAAGITHDLKNLLHPIKFASCLVREQYPDKKLHDLMALIGDSADRGIEMVNQVMGLFRVSEQRAEPLRVADLVAQLAALLRGAFPHLQIETEVAPGLPVVYGRANEIHQALLNLSMNAQDAMKGRGLLRLSAAPVELDAAFFDAEEPALPGAYLRLSVRDSGPGIPAELLPRIFQPLFTTKQEGAGTGLGLVSVTTIVRNHHGFARVRNLPEGGAQFDLYFPAGEARAEAGEEAGTPAPSLPLGAGQRIGLLTDEAALRAVFGDVLATYGYTVMAADGGAPAPQGFGPRGEGIDLLLLDAGLEPLGGLETARALQLRPGLPIVLVTTDPGIVLDPALRASGVREVLRRPFDTPRLLAAVAGALASPARH